MDHNIAIAFTIVERHLVTILTNKNGLFNILQYSAVSLMDWLHILLHGSLVREKY